MGSKSLARPSFATALLSAACVCAIALAAPVAASAACANESLRAEQGTAGLPGCMALEMVSPPKKLSLPAFFPWFSLDGERVAYRSMAGLADTPGLQFFAGDTYVAGRSASGWQTAPTSPPASADIYTGGAGAFGGSFAFDSDLAGWLSLGSTKSQVMVGAGRVYEGALDGSFAPFSPPMAIQDNSGSSALQFLVENIPAHGATDDLSRTVVQISRASAFYFDEDPRGPTSEDEVGGDRNSYVVSDGSLELLARDKDNEVFGGRCGTHLGGGADDRIINQGALSEDGEEIYFTTRPDQDFNSAEPEAAPVCSPLENPLRIMQRVGGPGQAVIAEIAPELPAGDDFFQGASADGSKAYFTTAREVTPADEDTGAQCSAALDESDGCDLYLFDSTKPEGSRISLVSSGEGAEVLSSITALSGDGARAYFAAQGVLSSDPNPEGDLPAAGQPNLYLYDAAADEISFVGTLAPGDKEGMWGSESSFAGNAYAVPLRGPGGAGAGDGHVLAFATEASLVAEDEDGGHSDVYRYDADAGTLALASSADPAGPFDVAVNPNPPALVKSNLSNFAERGRWASEDGQTLAFLSDAPLGPGDEDGDYDPYVWKEGQLAGLEAKVFVTDDLPTVSLDGSQVGIATSSKLLPQDRDLVRDVYVLRSEGGFAPPAPPKPPCDPLAEGACQGPAPAPPGAVVAPSSTLAGAGNVREPTKCKKGFVKKKGRCVKKKQSKPKKKQKAGKNRGAK